MKISENNLKFDVIIPIKYSDFETSKFSIDTLHKHAINLADVYIISNENIKNNCEIDNVKFIDENLVLTSLTYENLKNILHKYGMDEKRAGWYFQQFLKMSYAYISKTEYYLSWDADTLLLRNLQFFDETNHPYFTIKTEYHQPYFVIINKLLGLDKCIKGSFIAEHMLFKKSYMIELIEKIQNSDNSDKPWWKKIIYQISINFKEENSGFSEFETYGTFVSISHPNIYANRTLDMLRKGTKYLGNVKNIKSSTLAWAAKSFDTVSFENWDCPKKFFNKICNNTFIQQVFKFKTIVKIIK